MFGANQTPSLFGTPKTGGLALGTPAAGVTATPGGFTGFGSNNPSTVGSAGTLFSSTGLSSTTPALGASTTFTGFGPTPAATKTGFMFGQPSTTSTTMAGSAGTGLFGGLASTTTTSGFSSGLGTSSFGLTAPAAGGLGAPLTGFGTSVPSSVPSLGLGAFGTPVAATGAPTLGLGTSLTSTIGTAPFGSLSSAAAPSLGMGMFGTPATTSAAPSLGLGLFGSTGGITSTASAAPVLGLGGTQSTPAPITGLGGTGAAQTTGAAGDAKHDSKVLKEYPIPPEIVSLTEDFKKYIKEQKGIREEISRISSKSLFKVQEESASLKQLLSIISNGIQRNIASIRQLKDETIQELKHAETMQRTKDVPLALQYENTSPMEYFQQLFATFESKMQMYRQQINMMEKHLATSAQPFYFTPQELMQTVKKLHDTFIYLAAELQTIHETIEQQKDRYLTYRRLVHGETTNVFDSITKATRSTRGQGIVTTGPSPFSGAQSANIAAFVSAVERAQQPSGAPPTLGLLSNSLGPQMGFSSGLSGSNLFGTQSFLTGTNPSLTMGGSSLALKPLGASTAGIGSFTPTTPGIAAPQSAPVFGVANKPFQLQKPPVGNKRGKR